MDKGREADLEMYENELAETTDPAERKHIKDAANAIANESRKIRDMRRDVISDVRRGRSLNARDKSEWAQKHPEFNNA